MWRVFVVVLFVAGVLAEPETVRDTFDYLSYGNDDVLKNLDVGPPKEEIVLRPVEEENWPRQALDVGQVTAVALNSLSQPVIFHRGQRVWDENAFNESNVFQHADQGPVAEDTVLVLDPHTGAILDSWGAGFFYMPHGLTVDHHDNVWLTDVAKHQVFKYSPDNHRYPVLTVGEEFNTGPLLGHCVLLCMPTSVAVATTGEIFVADGYCNHQILKLNAAGKLISRIPTHTDIPLTLNVPHSVALLEQLDLVCVADRENMRVVCPKAGQQGYARFHDPARVIEDPALGRVFGVTARGNLLYAVTGPTAPQLPVRGYTMDARHATILDTWEPVTGFTNPHSLAVSKNGSHLYVTEIGPNKIWKFRLTDQFDK